MDYITSGEAAEKWGVSGRSITYHLVAGRIPGAIKKGKLWLIPANARRPFDKRRRGQALSEQASSLSSELCSVIAATSAPLPAHDPDAVLDSVGEKRARLQYEAELAYLRGDFARTLACHRQTEGNDAARLRACPVAAAAAISMGDYPTYTQMEAYLKRCAKAHPDGVVAFMAELAIATAAVSCIAPNMAPKWLKQGEFNVFPPQIRPYALYLRAKYFQCTGEYATMLAVAQTALALGEPERGFSQTGLYLRLCCAMACHALGQEDEALRWLLEAMRIALPHGFITPFAEVVTAFGGLVEHCLKREFPACYNTILEQWKRVFSNWIAFHNQFTEDNITHILSLREYHIAMLVARRVPYVKVAKQHCVSVGRLKNIMQEIYDKLFINSRNELAKYVL